MKKMSNKGFTLIELLAVITIMGILMMVAIPAVSRTIENSRRDTFASVSGEYLTAVRNGVLADEIECYYIQKTPTKDADGNITGYTVAEGAKGEWRVASSLADGTYYVPLCTSDAEGLCKELKESDVTLTTQQIKQSTTDLLESGGKSPFGSADVFGYVTWTKSTRTGTGANADEKTTTEYKVILQDSGKHGLIAEQEQAGLKRSNVSTAVTTPINNEKANATAFCKVS